MRSGKSDSQEVEKVAAEWVARRDAGCFSEADEQALEAWASRSIANRVALLRISRAWQQADRLRALGAGSPRGTVPPPGRWRLTPFATRGADCGRRMQAAISNRRMLLAVAASALLSVLLGSAWFWLAPLPNALHTDVGRIENHPLPDGSIVTLNTNTRIRFALTESERSVELQQGEAFFDVAKDPHRPFVVQAGDRRIVAVGTKFSVLRTDSEVRVVVTEGRVRVESGAVSVKTAEEPPAQLGAGSIALASDAGVVIREESVPLASQYLAWRTGYVMFHDTSLSDAVNEFNRYNQRKLVIGDPSIADLRIGGNLKVTNVDAFVRVLEHGFPIRSSPHGDQIVLKAR